MARAALLLLLLLLLLALLVLLAPLLALGGCGETGSEGSVLGLQHPSLMNPLLLLLGLLLLFLLASLRARLDNAWRRGEAGTALDVLVSEQALQGTYVDVHTKHKSGLGARRRRQQQPRRQQQHWDTYLCWAASGAVVHAPGRW
jgi:hypothetical protein